MLILFWKQDPCRKKLSCKPCNEKKEDSVCYDAVETSTPARLSWWSKKQQKVAQDDCIVPAGSHTHKVSGGEKKIV